MARKRKATKLVTAKQDQKNDAIIDDDDDSDYLTDDASGFFSYSVNSDTDDDSTDGIDYDIAAELAAITITTASTDAVKSAVDVGNLTENVVATENGVEVINDVSDDGINGTNNNTRTNDDNMLEMSNKDDNKQQKKRKRKKSSGANVPDNIVVTADAVTTRSGRRMLMQ